jgi:plasmid stabilization system protein ParE
MGASPSSIYDITTEYRFLVCGPYLIFYHPQGAMVLVDRILYGGRDHLAILFGNFPQDEAE